VVVRSKPANSNSKVSKGQW